MKNENNFVAYLIASLKKSESTKKVKEDVKHLGDIYIPLIGKLNISKTREEINKQLNGKFQIKFTANKVTITDVVKQIQNQLNRNPLQASFGIKKEKLINDIKMLGEYNSKLFKDAGMSEKYNSILDNAKLATSSRQLKILRQQLSAFRSELKVTHNNGLNFTDKLKNGLKKAIELFSSYGIVMSFTHQLRNAWNEAEKLDKVMTDLVKVNDEVSRNDFPRYLDKVIDKTKKLAVIVSDYIDSVTTFSRSGYNLSQAEILGEKATQLENVGDMTSEDASKTVLSGIQAYDTIDGYGIDNLAEKAQALNDKLNEIGNTASISTSEIAEGIREVGSVMRDSNTSLDEFIALLASGNRQVQDADKVALALRTSALRIRGCRTELEELGEESDTVIESTSKLAEKIEGLTNINGQGGVKILEDDEKTFRSIYDIYYDISKVYDDMSDVDASALLELIAGKNRSNQVSAVLNNMAEATDILNNSLSATGSATKEYNTYLESAKASTTRFNVAMTETYNNIINGNTVKALADSGTAVVSFANEWGLVESTLKGVVSIGIMKFLTVLSTGVKSTVIQLNNFGTALDTAKSISNISKGTTEYVTVLNKLKMSCASLTETQLKQVLSNTQLTNTERIKILQYQGLTRAQSQAKLTQMGLIQTTNAQNQANATAITSIMSLKASLIGLGTTIKSVFLTNPVGISIMAISTAIGVATSATRKFNEAVVQTRRKNIESADEASNNAKSLVELYNEYSRLSSIQNRTSSEEESFKQAVEEITKALQTKADVLKNLTSGTDEYREALRNATKEELKSSLSNATVGRKSAQDNLEDNVWDNWKGSKITVDTTPKGESLSDDAKRAVDIVSCALNDFETVNRTWNTLSWDISTPNADEVVKYYNALLKAREELISQKDEALLDTDIYKEIDNAINSLSESVDTYTEKLYEEQKINYMVVNEIPTTTEEYKKMEDALKSTVSKNDALKESFENLLTTDFADLKDNIDDVQTVISSTTSKSKSEIIDMVNSMSDGFEILDKIYSDVKDGDTFDFSNLDSSKFQEAFSGLEEEYTDFIETISSTSNDLSACQNAFNRLTTAYITQNGILADVTEETANVTIAMLNNMGVVNAEELVTRQLSLANEELGETGKKVKDATEDEIVAFVEKQRIIERLQAKQAIMEETGRKATEITEAEINAYMQENSALYETEQALAVYELAKVTANGTTIDVSGDIQNLMSLVKATGNACSALSALNKLKNGAINYSIGGKEGYDYLVKQAEQEVKNALNSMGNVETQYNGANKSNKSSGGSGSSKDTWLEEYKEKLSILNDNLDNELINEKEFYTKSEELLNQYLKDSPSHVEKYSKEIAEAEKNLHNAWNNSYEADKDRLGEKLSSGQINEVEYYKELTELVNEYYDELNCSPYGNYTKEVRSCMKEIEDAHNDAYDYEADELQKLLDNNTITEKQYIDKMSLIWDKYYKGQVKYAKRASETKLALLQKEKSYLQSLANAVSTVTGQEIDKLQEKQGKIVKKYEKEIKALEKQKKAIDKKIDALDDEKELLKDQEDIIQKQIDKIKDEADEEDKLYKLEKARYDLDKLKNQKTEKTIVDEQVVYKTDTSAISDAQNTLNGAERDYKIFQLEKEKDVLEEQIEVIEKQQEQLNKETEIIDKQIERIQEKIDSTNEYYEEKIEKIQKIQNEWQKALDYEEQAMAISLLKEKYGANVIEEILNGNMQSLSNWKQEYINTLGAIDIALNNQISSATLAYGELAGVTVNMSEATRLANGDLTTLSGSAEQLGIDTTALKDKMAETNDVMGNINSDSASSSFDNIGNSAKNAKDSISDIGTTTSNTANTMSGTQFKIDTSALQFSTELINIKKLQDELKVLVDSVKTSSSTIGTTIDVNSSKIDEVVWHLQQVLSKIQEIQRAMDLLQEKFGLIAQLDLTTINIKFDTLGFSIQNLITNLGNMINLVTGGETSLQSAFQLQTDSAIENLRLQEAEMNEPLTEAFDNIIAKLTELEEAITTETAVALNSFKEHYDGIMGKVVPAINHEIDRMEKFNKSAGKSINKTITITYKTKGSAKAGAYGQNALSSSFATGTKGEVKEDQLALIDELGDEILVRNGEAHLIKGGAQYIQLRKHDILFNHKQSEELLKRGKVTSGGGHGRQIGSFATGTLSDYQLKKLLEQDKKYKENGSIFQSHSFNGKDYSKIFDNINKRSVQIIMVS